MSDKLIVKLEFELNEEATEQSIIDNLKEQLDCFPCSWRIVGAGESNMKRGKLISGLASGRIFVESGDGGVIYIYEVIEE